MTQPHGLPFERTTWIEKDRLLAASYPTDDSAMAEVGEMGARILINLHERAHNPERLARVGITEVHLPVEDFTAPSAEVIETGVAAIEAAIAAGDVVAVHCGAGLGRTGTLISCYLVKQGMTAEEAIDRVRELRPGSVETASQVAAIEAFAMSIGETRQHEFQ